MATPNEKIDRQIEKAGLPCVGPVPFVPLLGQNTNGRPVIQKAAVTHGPKRGKIGYVDSTGRIWVKDRAHAGDPDHWDVQVDGGVEYFRIDLHGRPLA